MLCVCARVGILQSGGYEFPSIIVRIHTRVLHVQKAWSAFSQSSSCSGAQLQASYVSQLADQMPLEFPLPTDPSLCSVAHLAFALEVDRAAAVRSQSSLTERFCLCRVRVAHTSHVFSACTVFHRESSLVDQLPSGRANDVHTRGAQNGTL